MFVFPFWCETRRPPATLRITEFIRGEIRASMADVSDAQRARAMFKRGEIWALYAWNDVAVSTIPANERADVREMWAAVEDYCSKAADGLSVLL